MKFLALISFIFCFQSLSAQNWETYFDSTSQLYGIRFCETTEPEFDYVYPFTEDFYVVGNSEKYGLFSPKGSLVVPMKFDSWLENDRTSYLFFFNLDSMYVWRQHDLKFKDTFVLAYDKYSLNIDDGRSYLSVNELFEVMDQNGMAMANLINGIVISIGSEKIFDLTFECKDEMVTYFISKKEGKYSVCDKSGKLIHSIYFDDYLGKEGETIIIKIKDKIQFLNLCSGKLSSSFSGFKNRICSNEAGQKGMIDNNGKIIFPFEYSNIKDYRNGYYLMEKENSLVGIFDRSSNNYLDEGDLNFDWNDENCSNNDFLKDIHGAVIKSDSEEKRLAVYIYDASKKKLVRKSEFEYWMMDCYIDKAGTVGIWKDENQTGRVDRKGNIVWK